MNTPSKQRLAILALLAVNGLFLLWYIAFGQRNEFHSDSAAQYLVAREAIVTGHYFVRDWNYVNGDIWAYYANTFMIPALWTGAKGYLAFALSRLAPSLLVLLGTYLVATLVTTRARALLAAAVLAAGLSPALADNLYGQVSYGTYYYLACFVAYFGWRSLHHARRLNPWMAATAVILVLAFWTNPSRAISTYVLPLVGALALMVPALVGRPTGWHGARSLQLIGAALLAAVVGIALYVTTLAQLNPPVGYADVKWLPFAAMAQNLVHTLHGVLGLLDAVPMAGDPVLNPRGVYWAMRLVAGLIVIVLMATATWRAFKSTQAATRYVASFALVSFAVAVFFHLTSTLPNMEHPVGSARYLVPSMLLMLVLAIAAVPPLARRQEYLTVAASWIAIAMLASSAYPSLVAKNIVPRAAGESRDVSGLQGLPISRMNPNQRLADFLDANDLRYGYSSFWHASAITVLSKERVQIRHVNVENRMPVPARWLSADRWYEPKAWDGEVFFAFDTAEQALVDWAQVQAVTGRKLLRTLSFEDQKIYVFDSNDFSNIPGWQRTMSSGYSLFMNAKTPRQIGDVVTDAQTGRTSLVAHKGQSGLMHFGPYLQIPAGNYEVSFDLDIADATPGSVRVDVVAAQGTKVLGVRELPDGAAGNAVRIALDKPETLEFRVISHGKSEVGLKGISIRPAK